MSIYYNMKAIFTTLMLFFATLFANADMTDGVFYVDAPVECHLVSQNGNIATNHLSAGNTYMVGNVLLEMNITNKTTFHFSGGPMIDIAPKSAFSINLFDQEVKNLTVPPRKADFGSHNLSVSFGVGEYSVVYPNKNPGSMITVATPFITYQLSGGKYFFRVSDKSIIVYVLEGMMQVHGDKNKVDTTDKGKLAVAIPFTDPASGVEDKIITSIKTLKPEEMERFSSPVLIAERKWGDVQFFVINGRVIGLWMK